MKNLYVLEINSNFNGRNMIIFPVLICDGAEMVLVDTGIPGQTELFKAEAEKKGISLENLTKIVITHHDIDHIGSLAEMKREFKNVKVVSSEIEGDYITGEKESARLEHMRNNFDKFTEERKQWFVKYQDISKKLERIEVDILLKDNEMIPGCSKIRAIQTPGHLPGHMSVYAEESRTLIAGDALGLMDGKLFINSQNTLDMSKAKDSVRKMLELNIDNIVCYHGGLFRGDCKQALQDILNSQN